MRFPESISISLLNKSLDGLWERQKAITDNLANIDTPGYKPKEVSFEDDLRAKLAANTLAGSRLNEEIKKTGIVTKTKENETTRADGNGVNLEKENVELMRTQFNYYASLQLVSDTFNRLKTAINSGK